MAQKDGQIGDKTINAYHAVKSGTQIGAPSIVKHVITNRQHATKRRLSFLIGTCRFLVVDFPLLLLFALYLSTLTLRHIHDEYLKPQLDLMKIDSKRQREEMTYYHRICDIQDLTATDTKELLIGGNTTAEDAKTHMLKHGMQMYPNILSHETADAFRDFVIEHNQNEPGFWVIESENRWSFGITADQDPIVPIALKEIATHPILRPALEKIVGKNPAMIEFTAITSAEGAVDQFWHSDVLSKRSSQKMARTFAPSYSLFIPLQDTTSEMGATELCPGSHICSELPDYCSDHGFQGSGADDLWPKGYGALLNQQVYHRGAANVAEGAPHRAVLILTFTPRPRFGDNELETRQLSQGGSYSMHWTQWGFTMDDLAEASSTMVQPWATLRTLGIYKPANREWGWDMITQTSMRISNNDNGYKRFNLDVFVEDGGFSFLPGFVQEELSNIPYEEDSSDEDENSGWYEFLTGTMHLCEQWIGLVYRITFGVCIFVTVVLNLAVLLLRGSDKKNGYHGNFLLRLAMFHGIVALLPFLIISKISQSSWAKHIQSKKLYQLPNFHNRDPFSIMGPATIPSKTDVLISTRMNSECLGSFQQLLEVTHPGNEIWKGLIERSCPSYQQLPPSLRDHLNADIIKEIKGMGGRFLLQNEVGNWFEQEVQDIKATNHRELMIASRSILQKINKEIEYVLSESRFGPMQNTIMHKVFVPKFWFAIQRKLLSPDDQEESINNKRYGTPFISSTFRLPAIPSGARMKLRRSGFIALPQVSYREISHDHYSDKWLKEGDTVDGRYRGTHNEWYKGVIREAPAFDGLYHVQYEDGEMDWYLGLDSLRPYYPHEVDEHVQYRINSDVATMFTWGRVIATWPNEIYDIVDFDGRVDLSIPVSNIRRVEEGLVLGANIEAIFNDQGNEWYPGRIAYLNPDGTFDVEFEDGDAEESVRFEHIRFRY